VRRTTAIAGAVVAVSVVGAVAAVAQDGPTVEDLLDQAERTDVDTGRVGLDLDAFTPGLDLEAFIEDISGDVVVDQGDEEVELDLDADVLFAFGSADLTDEAADTLARAADEVASLGRGRGALTIIGHTDAIGAPEDNQVLSEDRARAVAAELEVLLGSAYDYQVEGRGEDEPAAPNTRADGSDNEPGRALNRRVEVRFEAG
jgi:outer membrane protein OmpA-like peptidoglycan-associated protein